MNTELLKQKIREYFDNISPEELITKFEKMGYSFVDVTEQSEPLPDSFESYMSEARDEFILAIKNVERSNFLLTAVDSFLICFDQMRDKLVAASIVSEATDAELTKLCMAVSEKSLEKEWAEPLGEDAIGFAEWVVSDNNPAPNKYNSDDDNNGKWCDAFSEGINRHYYKTEELYKLYRKQSKQEK